MNQQDADLLRNVDAALGGLAELDRALEITDDRDGLTLLSRIRGAFNGWPTGSSFETDRTSGHTTVTDDAGNSMPAVADPTGEAAIRPDRAAEDLRQLQRKAKVAAQTVADMLAIAGRYSLRQANRVEVQTPSVPGCDSCARVASPGTVGHKRAEQTPWFNRVDITTTLADGTKGALCDWCFRGVVGVKHTGEMPKTGDVEARRDGKKLRKVS